MTLYSLPAIVNTDYTDKDFDSMRARLAQLVRSVFPAWTDETSADFGNILLSSFAFVAEVLTYYQDINSRESRLATAQLRRSILGIVKLIGYQPSGATAATVDLVVTLDAPVQAGATFTLAAGDTFKTAEVTAAILYQVVDAVTFLAGESEKTITVENSTTTSVVVGSTGLANQNFAIPLTPYLDDSAEVTFANGTFTQVDNFLDSSATDRHFVVVVDQNDRATLRFGNGVNGTIPSGNGTIVYKYGGGSTGRVEAGALVQPTKTYQDSMGAFVRVTCTNPAASSPAQDRETNAHIVQHAPASLRVLGRAVAREDFEIVAEGVSGVARALMVTNNEVAGIPENTGYLLLVPPDGGTVSGAILTEVLEQFVRTDGVKPPYPKVNTFNVIVQQAAYLVVDIDAVIYVAAGFTPAQAKESALDALEAFFEILEDDGSANPSINFGYYFQDEDEEPTGTLDWSAVFNAVRDASGVRKVDAGADGFLMNGARADLTIAPTEFPKLGTVVIRNGATGQVI